MVMDKQRESTEIIPRIRQMHPLEKKVIPGPDFYSVKAAETKSELKTIGPQRQSTVDLNLCKGDRYGFVFSKTKDEYVQNAHHELTCEAKVRSSLNASPNIDFDHYIDRDRLSEMKEQF